MIDPKKKNEEPTPNPPKKKILVKKKPTGIELTENYDKQKNKMSENLKKSEPGSDDVKDGVQGITINKKTEEAKADSFEHGIKKGATHTEVYSNDRKTILYRGPNKSKATEEAIRKSNNQVTDTNAQREYNANHRNVTSGAKVELDESDKRKLVALRSARYTNGGK